MTEQRGHGSGPSCGCPGMTRAMSPSCTSAGCARPSARPRCCAASTLRSRRRSSSSSSARRARARARCCAAATGSRSRPAARSRFDGVDLMARATDINAMRRKIGMVFQSFNLYPHMTALGNVTLALRKVVGQVARRGGRARHGGARPRRPCGEGEVLSGRALRRPAAARRDRPRARARADRHAVRRADLGARSRARRLRARRDARAQGRRHDHAGGQPRDALRARRRRPRDLHGSRR